jgi:hypothetical protein
MSKKTERLLQGKGCRLKDCVKLRNPVMISHVFVVEKVGYIYIVFGILRDKFKILTSGKHMGCYFW